MWDDQNENDLLFRDENPFASNVARRQRGGARRKANTTNAALSSLYNDATRGEMILRDFSMDLLRESSASTSSAESNSQTSLCTVQLSERMLDHARAKAYSAFVVWDGTFSSDLWGCLYRRRNEFFPQGNNPLFDAAWDAFCLRRYSVTNACKKADLEASEKYARALFKLSHDLHETDGPIRDELLITALVLAGCEDIAGGTDSRFRFMRGYTHMKGALAMVELRRSQLNRPKSEIELDNIVRGRAVRQAVYKGDSIPRSMCEDLQNEDGALDITLDIYLGRVANLRHRVIDVFTRFETYSLLERKKYSDELMDLLRTATRLDGLLEQWYKSLPPLWTYDQCYLSDARYNDLKSTGIFFTKRFDDYSISGLDIATLLNRYRAGRLMCLGYISRILTMPYLVNSLEGSQSELQNIAQRLSPPLTAESVLGYTIGMIRIFSNEIIQSIPAYFSHPDSPANLLSSSVLANAAPAKLMQLVWPIIITSSIAFCPEAERQFVKGVIGTIGKLSGHQSLKRIPQLNLHCSHVQRVVNGELFHTLR